MTVPALLAAVALWLRVEYLQSEMLRQEATGSFERRMGLVTILSNLKDAVTAQRGYLLTGDARFLKQYERARASVREELRTSAATQAFPPAYLAEVERLQKARFAELDRAIDLGSSGDGSAAVRLIASGDDRNDTDRLGILIGERIAAETVQTERARAASTDYRATLQRSVYAAFGAMIGIVLSALLLLWQSRSQRHALLVEALEAGKRHATILDSTIDAILILNPSGTVDTVNDAATRMLGYREQELERRDIATILDLAQGEGSFHACVGLGDGRLRRSFLPDRSVRHRDGHAVAVDVAVGVMDVPSGVHLVVSLRDIAERKRLERVKDELISTVSHELRTPLTSVVGSLGLLRAGVAGPIPAGAARLVDIAENNSHRLIRLINDMLDIDRIGSGALVMEQAPLDLRTVIEEACLGSEGLARASGITLSCAPLPEAVIVSGDADRLVQVVTNLVSNAVHAAPARSAVDLVIEIDGDRAIVAVDDRGAGVPTAFRDRIFGRFERATADGGAIGTGLGLAISREIVVRHGGTIWFEDRAEGGTRFAFSLPLASTSTSDGDVLTVLVCQEDDQVADDLASLVMAEGCVPVRVRSGDEGRAALASAGLGALLVSMTLPDEGGLAFAHAAREGDPPYDGPIIVVAAAFSTDSDSPPVLDVVDWVDESDAPERLGRALRSALARSNAPTPVVLHLDDDQDLLEVVAAAIGSEARIVGATDIAEARSILHDISPDVAILDLRLAEGSGLDLIPFLIDKDGVAVPTIIYSAQDVSPEEARFADAVLVKARGSIPDLKATIRRIVRPRVST